jgi:hypothetical protein
MAEFGFLKCAESSNPIRAGSLVLIIDERNRGIAALADTNFGPRNPQYGF